MIVISKEITTFLFVVVPWKKKDQPGVVVYASKGTQGKKTAQFQRPRYIVRPCIREKKRWRRRVREKGCGYYLYELAMSVSTGSSNQQDPRYQRISYRGEMNLTHALMKSFNYKHPWSPNRYSSVLQIQSLK